MSQPQSKYPNDPEQTRWLTMAKRSQRAAFDNIVEKYQQPVYTLCYHMLNDAAEAEDAAQEAFIRAYFKLDSYDDTRQFSTWLFAIASHYCLDQLRKRRFQVVSWDDLSPWQRSLPSETGHPERALLEAEVIQEVRHLLEALPPALRMPVILKYWHGLTCEEIAETMNTTVSAIKCRLFRARKKMAAQAAQAPQTTTLPVTSQQPGNSASFRQVALPIR